VQPVNIGNDEEITVRQVAEEVVRLSGSRSVIRFTDRPVDDPERRRPDLTRAMEVLNWRPTVPREQGLRETIESFRRSIG